MSNGKILFKLSGSIACFKACQVISRLVQDGFEVEVVATHSALEFVGAATLEGLTGRKIHSDTFAPGAYMKHIHLMRWADLVLVCPATANTINKLAAGIGDDLLTSLFLAHDFHKPYLVAPAMNASMLGHPATRSSLARLGEWGAEILPTRQGQLACGEVGDGRLLEPEAILIEVKKHFSKIEPTKSCRILITSGGTEQPIDEVRSITNFSTGRTAALIASCLHRHGHQIVFLRAVNSAPIDVEGPRERTYRTFSELRAALQDEIKNTEFHFIIHAAAVSDYLVSEIRTADQSVVSGKGKIDSANDLILHLARTPKIVSEIKAMARSTNLGSSDHATPRLIAFKLTNSPSPAVRLSAIERLAEQAKPDWIVHNDFSEISETAHIATIYSVSSSGQVAATTVCRDKAQLAEQIARLIKESS